MKAHSNRTKAKTKAKNFFDVYHSFSAGWTCNEQFLTNLLTIILLISTHKHTVLQNMESVLEKTVNDRASLENVTLIHTLI